MNAMEDPWGKEQKGFIDAVRLPGIPGGQGDHTWPFSCFSLGFLMATFSYYVRTAVTFYVFPFSKEGCATFNKLILIIALRPLPSDGPQMRHNCIMRVLFTVTLHIIQLCMM